MKKCLLVFSGLFVLMFFVNAVPISLYLGTSNSFSFPIIRGDLHSTLTSLGFSGTSEVGIDVLGWQFGGLFNAALWGSGDGKDGLMKNFMAIQIGLAINKEFDNSLIPIFPDWFGFHSAFSVRYGIFHTEHFRTSQAKIAGNYNITEGDAISLVNKFAGEIRTWLGENLDIINKDSYEFCFIVDFPMYELNPETNKIDFTHNPFSMPQGGMDALLNKEPTEIFAYQYDIVCNGVELSSGAVRNHNPEIMKKAFEIAGYGEEDVKAKFGALYTAFSFGAPPHAGMAPGVDRMVMLIAGEETIRDVIAFPLNGNAQDLMMGAPGGVTEQQLKEANIQIRE
jgi:hypothetical protein